MGTPAKAMTKMLDTYTKMKNEENKLKMEIIKQRLIRQMAQKDREAMQDRGINLRGKQEKEQIDYRSNKALENYKLRKQYDAEHPSAVSDKTIQRKKELSQAVQEVKSGKRKWSDIEIEYPDLSDAIKQEKTNHVLSNIKDEDDEKEFITNIAQYEARGVDTKRIREALGYSK